MTMNPLRHLDIMGTLVLVMSGFRFGWAKPVPVNIYNFRDPKFGMLVSAAAGPAANFLMAIACGIALRIFLPVFGGTGSGFSAGLFQVLYIGLMMNLALAFFNLIPIPPLDGSKILLGLAPPQWEEPLFRFNQIGPMLLFGLIMIGFLTHVSILWLIIGPPVKLFFWLFSGISLG